ncbi:MAG: GtrA family protein [Clostridia bacterium]|nr:GtrA family protein [Clostridia bacterium]
MIKIKELFNKYREIIMYLIFGVLTTVVGMGSYLIILEIGKAIGLATESGDPTYALRLTAQILQWVLSVLFAFFTNRKWVFNAETSNKPFIRQLAEFSGSRVITLILDTLVTFGTVWLLGVANYIQISIFSKDLIAKCVAAVVVVIGNYILSKLWVFKK